MANTTKQEKSIKALFIGECWEYLRKNFRKFNETNKIKIALELCKKDVPQEFTGKLEVNQMPTIEKTPATGGTPIKLEFNIGSLNPPANT